MVWALQLRTALSVTFMINQMVTIVSAYTSTLDGQEEVKEVVYTDLEIFFI